MSHRRNLLFAAASLAVIVLAGCTAPAPRTVEGSTIAVALADPFFSSNPGTKLGDTPGNRAVAAATTAGFSYYDESGAVVMDDSFGTVTKVSDDPLVVTYTVADGVTWSDGVAVDAADLLLAWAAGSGAVGAPFENDPSVASGLGLVLDQPEISDDRKSITMTYSQPDVDWQGSFFGLSHPGMPAHIVARDGLGIDDPDKAKQAVISAIRTVDAPKLLLLAGAWNTSFDYTDITADSDPPVSSGPYIVTELVGGQFVTLTANPLYTGNRRPIVAEITVRFIEDPLAQVQALLSGGVQVIAPEPSTDVVDALASLPFTTLSSTGARYEHIDLTMDQSKSGAFGDVRVREAFLKTIPRQAILEELVAPVDPAGKPRDSFLFTPGAEGYAASVADNGSDAFADVDIEGAKALLAEVGVSGVGVCVLYAPDDPRRVHEFALIRDSAALAGFAVSDCSSPDWINLLGVPGSYDAALYAWNSISATAFDDLQTFSSGGSENFSHYSNPDVDGLLTQLVAEPDADARRALREKIDAALWADGYGVPLFQHPALVAFDQARVSNVTSSPRPAGALWNVWDWKPAEATSQ